MASQNRSLARFELKKIPAMNAGAARVRVTFTVDADGLLTVTAKEQSTGVEQQVEVKPSYGLSEQEMLTMLRQSMEHAKEDMQARLLAESKVEAKRLVLAVESGLKEDVDLLENKHKLAIEVAMQSVIKTLEEDDREAIIAAKEHLEKITQNFAAARMEVHIANALKGQHIQDVDP
jgi:molecular chaperone HscA